MFRKSTILSLAILFPVCGYWVFQMAVMRTVDLDTYRKLVEKKEIASSQNPSPTQQSRKGVRKDIWFTQMGTDRLHYQIYSDQSLLTLIPLGGKFEVVESLEGIRCWMQDKLLPETDHDDEKQQARYFEADNGEYRHATQEFIANDVALSLFRLPGHELPKKPIDSKESFLHGNAYNISFYFGGKTPQFQAHDFQASMVKE